MKAALPTVFAVLAVLAAPAAARGQEVPIRAADAALADRVMALSLDARCDLFADDVRVAVRSGVALARNALLRAQWDDAAVASLERQGAAAADLQACDGAEAGETVNRVLTGFEGWRQLTAMTFPGDHRTWTATRREFGEGWLLVQDIARSESSPAAFGLARRADGGEGLVLALPSAPRPRAARMLVRDPAIAPTRVLGELRRLATSQDTHPLAALTAPDVFTTTLWAADREEPPADSSLSQSFAPPVTLLWFPESLTERLSALDPREAVAIDVDVSSRRGEVETTRLYLEIGDFEAARLFATTGNQPSSSAASAAPPNPAFLIR